MVPHAGATATAPRTASVVPPAIPWRKRWRPMLPFRINCRRRPSNTIRWCGPRRRPGLDLCGGWTDTPPICFDRGGVVVNAAVKLNGQYPLQAIAKLNPEYVVNLTSIDLGQRITLDRIEQTASIHRSERVEFAAQGVSVSGGLRGGRTKRRVAAAAPALWRRHRLDHFQRTCPRDRASAPVRSSAPRYWRAWRG